MWTAVIRQCSCMCSGAWLVREALRGEVGFTWRITNPTCKFFENVGVSFGKNLKGQTEVHLDYIGGYFSLVSSFDHPDSNETLQIILKLKSSAAGQDETGA